jgi:hypothetical protein
MFKFYSMEIDWLSLTTAGLAIAILAGGLLMMFTSIWTSQGKRNR